MATLGIDIGGSGIKGAPVDITTGDLTEDRFRVETPQPATPDPTASGGGDERLAFVRRDGYAELARLSISAAGHEAWLELDPALPDLAALKQLEANVVVITTHALHTNKKWADEQGFEFPILSDFWPHGATAQAG